MTPPHEDHGASPSPAQGVIGTAGMIDRLRGPASHVIVDVVDPGVGGATPVRQGMTSCGVQPEKPSTPPALLLSAGIVVGATVVSAGVVNLVPATAALTFAAAIIIWLRTTNRRARRTDENTRWASRSGQAFGDWDPKAPGGRQRLLLDHRGLAIVDLGVQREPMAVLLWKSVERLILVPGNERSTDPGLVVHRTDGRVAGFTTSFGLHELMPALDDVGLPTDIEQAMTGATSVRRMAGPIPPPTPPPAPTDPWASVAPPLGAMATATGATAPPSQARRMRSAAPEGTPTTPPAPSTPLTQRPRAAGRLHAQTSESNLGPAPHGRHDPWGTTPEGPWVTPLTSSGFQAPTSPPAADDPWALASTRPAPHAPPHDAPSAPAATGATALTPPPPPPGEAPSAEPGALRDVAGAPTEASPPGRPGVDSL